MPDVRGVIEAYWAAADARDWDAFSRLLSDEVVYRGPQAREEVRGLEAYLRFNREGFPDGWRIEVTRVVSGGAAGASWVEATRGDGTVQTGVCFFELSDDGEIVEITDFWPEPYELPASRAHLVERY